MKKEEIEKAKRLINDFLLIVRIEHLEKKYRTTIKEANDFLRGE